MRRSWMAPSETLTNPGMGNYLLYITREGVQTRSNGRLTEEGTACVGDEGSSGQC